MHILRKRFKELLRIHTENGASEPVPREILVEVEKPGPSYPDTREALA
jgi:hypothetical protein